MVDKKIETPAETETVLDNDGNVIPEHAGGAADEQVQEVEPEKPATPAASVTTDGKRARRAFMMKQFLPDADYINVNIVAKGKGTRATLGRVFGIATGTDGRNNTLPDGKVVTSIVVQGIFQSESYVTGELGEMTNAYLPMAYAEKIDAMFKGDMTIKAMEIDCDIGLEATGKTIPYEWVITAFREGEEMAVLNKLRASRGRPADAPALPAPAATKALTDQTV